MFSDFLLLLQRQAPSRTKKSNIPQTRVCDWSKMNVLFGLTDRISEWLSQWKKYQSHRAMSYLLRYHLKLLPIFILRKSEFIYMFCIHINVYNSTKVRHLNFIFKMKTCMYIYICFVLYHRDNNRSSSHFVLIRHPLSLFPKNNGELITKTENDS